eukprot:CAMPEP_0179175404 /NCGR_PEP_ID=MMETSP0796-20121207/86625_1 /TAXON_ID=73915 /ORGANISM="Pyrodinium bahamense, Strain pbaha01" /LENGTH=61 /DNA_ID=CAMNT_0020878739 /DNA_START=42 /DNA_END=227 /DNA_ORIENTATION=-
MEVAYIMLGLLLMVLGVLPVVLFCAWRGKQQDVRAMQMQRQVREMEERAKAAASELSETQL